MVEVAEAPRLVDTRCSLKKPNLPSPHLSRPSQAVCQDLHLVAASKWASKHLQHLCQHRNRLKTGPSSLRIVPNQPLEAKNRLSAAVAQLLAVGLLSVAIECRLRLNQSSHLLPKMKVKLRKLKLDKKLMSLWLLQKIMLLL